MKNTSLLYTFYILSGLRECDDNRNKLSNYQVEYHEVTIVYSHTAGGWLAATER